MSTRSRAFSLIEMMVTMLIVCVVLAFAIPSLLRTRAAADQVRCESHIRECSAAMAYYTQDHRETFPFFADPKVDNGLLNGGMDLPFFFQSMHWPLALRAYLAGSRVSPIQLCPGGQNYADLVLERAPSTLRSYPDSYVFPSEYYLGLGFFTDQAMWRDASPGNVRSLRRAIRTFMVATPSSKGLMVEPRIAHLRLPIEGRAARVSLFEPEGRDKSYVSALCDGAVKVVPYRDFVPGRAIDAGEGAPILTTREGCGGIDLR